MTTKVAVISVARSMFSAFSMTLFEFDTREEAIRFAKDEDRSLRQTYEFSWLANQPFYLCCITAMVVEERFGSVSVGFTHWCHSDEEVAKECKDRPGLKLEEIMAERKQIKDGRIALTITSNWSE
jgi:hypothetical protein